MTVSDHEQAPRIFDTLDTFYASSEITTGSNPDRFDCLVGSHRAVSHFRHMDGVNHYFLAGKLVRRRSSCGRFRDHNRLFGGRHFAPHPVKRRLHLGWSSVGTEPWDAGQLDGLEPVVRDWLLDRENLRPNDRSSIR